MDYLNEDGDRSLSQAKGMNPPEINILWKMKVEGDYRQLIVYDLYTIPTKINLEIGV